MAITERDAAALLEIVHEGGAEDGTDAFPTRVLSGLARLIPSDVFVGYEEGEFVPAFRLLEEIDVVGENGAATAASLGDVFREYGWQNPICGRVHARNERVLRLSSVLTARERRRLDFDALVWRPLEIHDSLKLWLPPDGRRVRSIYLERSSKNYTNRDVALLTLLRPHLIRIRINAELRRRAAGRRGLTAREAEVLGWIARGKRNAEIARLLYISPHTVRKHVENIFEKLGVRTRTAAVAELNRL